MKRLVLCLALSAALPAYALEMPSPSPFDSRIRTVTYNPQDVVTIDVVPGIATHLILEEGEQYVTHAPGTKDMIEFAMTQNHVLIRPTFTDPDSNLVLVTNRRSYHFRLVYTTSRKRAMYAVEFRYPDSEAKKLRELAKASVLAESFERRDATYNLAYCKAGDASINLVNAWDNGTMTYMKFAGDIPAVYQVDAAGNESLVNRTMQGAANDVVVLHKLSGRWMLRLGKDAALAVADNRDGRLCSTPDATIVVGAGRSAAVDESGTASPDVRRVIKGVKQ